jgi:hypothetical protein
VGSIVEAIRGAIPESTTAIEYLRKVESQFTSSSKAYASTLIKRLVIEKYKDGGIREHILRMSNMASKLEPMEMELETEFLVHLVFASLPKEFDSFEVNYNLHPKKWDIEKLIAMCVQEKEGLKGSHSGSVKYVKQNKKRSYLDKNDKPQGKPQWERGCFSKSHGKAPQNIHHPRQSNEEVMGRDQCRWYMKIGHYQKDCLKFLKYLNRKIEDHIIFVDESLYLSYAKSTWWIDSSAIIHVANSL